MAPQVPETVQNTRAIDPNTGRAFNQFTRTKYDLCSLENQTRVSSKPMKYFVNQYNSPQVDPFETYSVIGNQKVYDVRNEFERPLPSRLNPIYQTYTEPYNTTPNLSAQNTSRKYVDTGTNLRWGADIRPKQSQTSLGEVDFNRWSPGVLEGTVQNAGQLAVGGSMQPSIRRDGYYDYQSQNNVIFGNSALPGGSTGFGISSRNLLHNYVQVNRC